MDDEIREKYALDGIVTLVDAAHIEQQLGRSDESTEQIAFADVLVLNKTDLVDGEPLDNLEARLRDMNRMARVVRSERANVAVDTVINLGAFDLDQVLERRPTFLEPEYPFEWTGVYSLDAGRYQLSLADGPDPAMSLVIVSDQGTDDASLRDSAEWCVRLYAETAKPIDPGDAVPLGQHVELQLESPGRKSFDLEVGTPVQVGLYAQHTAEEFDLRLTNAEGVEIEPVAERTWVAQHEHDDEVGSIAIERDGDVDPDKLNAWLSNLLREHGVDIFRMKGFISLAGETDRFVFQGVHMLFDGQPDRPWGDSPRRNQLVFIGRNLDEQSMRQGFEACLV
jgi:G3E family GTPase